MTYQQFTTAINEFDLGNAPFNEGNAIDGFLFNNRWYPARAFVNFALKDNNINNHASIKKLTSLIPYIRIKEDVNFNGANQKSLPLTADDKKVEYQLVIQRLNDLAYSS